MSLQGPQGCPRNTQTRAKHTCRTGEHLLFMHRYVLELQLNCSATVRSYAGPEKSDLQPDIKF